MHYLFLDESYPREKLDESLFRTGETDGTDDIRSMARTDNIWSQCSLSAI